jgi:hypothetical protein
MKAIDTAKNFVQSHKTTLLVATTAVVTVGVVVAYQKNVTMWTKNVLEATEAIAETLPEAGI